MADTISTPSAVIDPKPGITFRAVVFDLDGVLIHSAPCHRDAFIEVLTPLGVEHFDYSRFAGWRTRDVVDFVLDEAGISLPEDQRADAAARKSERARQLMSESLPIVPGCVEMLNQLSRDGLVIALASSGSRESVGLFLDSSGARSLFRSVLTGGDVKLAKPDPEIYSRTFERIGVPPSEGLVVEDAVAGVQAARMAGAAVVGIAGTSNPADLLAAGALDVLDSASLLPSWLNSRRTPTK